MVAVDTNIRKRLINEYSLSSREISLDSCDRELRKLEGVMCRSDYLEYLTLYHVKRLTNIFYKAYMKDRRNILSGMADEILNRYPDISFEIGKIIMKKKFKNIKNLRGYNEGNVIEEIIFNALNEMINNSNAYFDALIYNDTIFYFALEY